MKGVGIFLLVAFIVTLSSASSHSQDLQIHCIDVGQGSSELIIGPDGTTILIDGGTSSMGRTDVLPYLDTIFPPGSRTLDYVICSHDHSDHYGGLNYVLDNGYAAGTIYHCGGATYGFGRGVPIPVGTTMELGSGAVATCVLANGHFIDGTSISVGSDKNGQSICLLVEYRGFDYITAGDLPGSLEDDLAEMLVNYINPSEHPIHPDEPYLNSESGVDILHVNHHGSRYSSYPQYVNLLKCEIAVINGGTSYGHPHRDAVDRLLTRQTYTISCSCSGGSSTCGRSTGITVPGAEVYRTTAGGVDCRRSPEGDCPTIGDIIIITDGSLNYSVEGTSMERFFKDIDQSSGEDDSDGDGLTDGEENDIGTDPLKADTDEDGYGDLIEIRCGSPAIALSAQLKPETIGINIQPREAALSGKNAPDFGDDYTSQRGFGWNP